MFELLLKAWYLQFPVVVGGVLHMLAVTRQWLPGLTVPIYTPWFGANKTWRGLLLMPLLSALGALLLYPTELWLGTASPLAGKPLVLAGIIAGLGYILAELPNSFLKRRLGIPPGGSAERHRLLFILLDQLDSGIGVAVAWWLYLSISATQFAVFVLSFPVTALVVKRLLFWARLKKSAV